MVSWVIRREGERGAEIKQIVNGLINTQMYNFPEISIVLIFKLSPALFHQWTPDIYEGVRFIRQNPTLYIYRICHDTFFFFFTFAKIEFVQFEIDRYTLFIKAKN
ncbi:hypothetical protein QJS04_geneDACA013722 [Acorus gramineus]|uniref:Uncharacterized protein n=1 Tax=Acorus gramineus TaxID=55184 RepID=A0AAV9AYI9_ACOGR|nr:hypothetical protein QJS04_geneDACA013722 [Acorus gramineus]